jgi:hypothetical protein
MLDCVKARLKNARLRLASRDYEGAFRFAYEALDMFLRQLCFQYGEVSEQKMQKKCVSKWGFAECVGFLQHNYIITKSQASLLFNINNLRIPVVHYGRNPSEREAKDAIGEIEHFIQGRGVCASAIMNQPVVGVDLTDSLSRAKDLMLKGSYSYLPVFKGRKSVGSISEATFVGMFPQQDLASEVEISEVMGPLSKRSQRVYCWKKSGKYSSMNPRYL